MPTSEEVHKFMYEEGEKQRRKVMGDAHVDKATAKGISEFSKAAQDLATEAAWGTIWTRPGLTHAQRSLVAITILSTMGKQIELAGHIRGALRNGLTEVEIREVLLQVMVYSGMPNGLEAFRTVDAVIQAYKEENQQ